MVQRPRRELKMSAAGLEVIGGALREVEEGAEAAVAAGTRWKPEMRGTSQRTVRVEAIMQAINWAASKAARDAWSLLASLRAIRGGRRISPEVYL